MALFSSGTPRFDNSDLPPGQFYAWYYSGCAADCGSRIQPGQIAMFAGDEAVHVDCSPKAPARENPVCQRCFIAHAGECF